MPVNYNLGKVYKIVDYTNNNCYIGSTCEPILARRLAGHVSKYRSYLNGKANNVTSFEIIKNGNYNILLIEEYPCETKDQLLAREGHYIETMDCINKCKAGKFNELGSKEYFKQPHIIEYHKKKYNCICGGKHTYHNKSIHKKTPKHQNYLKNLLNNHDQKMKEIDIVLNDINNFINNLN
jgi:hypothetical protein